MRSLLRRLRIGYRGKPTGPVRGPARRSASPVGCSLAERRACKFGAAVRSQWPLFLFFPPVRATSNALCAYELRTSSPSLPAAPKLRTVGRRQVSRKPADLSASQCPFEGLKHAWVGYLPFLSAVVDSQLQVGVYSSAPSQTPLRGLLIATSWPAAV